MSIVTFPAPSLSVAGGSGPICLGYAQAVASQGSVTSEVDVTGLSATVYVPAGRTIQVTVSLYLSSSVAGDTAYYRIQEDGVTKQNAIAQLPTTQATATSRSVVLSPSAGVHTYKARLGRNTGTGNITSVAGAAEPAFILVEDITGTPAPGVGYTTPACRVYHNANQSLAHATDTYLAFNTESNDSTGMHDTVTNNSRITIAQPGLYVVTGDASFQANGTGYRYIGIMVNRAAYYNFTHVTSVSAGSAARLNVSDICRLVAGDYVELIAGQSSGGALNVEAFGLSPSLAVCRMGAD